MTRAESNLCKHCALALCFSKASSVTAIVRKKQTLRSLFAGFSLGLYDDDRQVGEGCCRQAAQVHDVGWGGEVLDAQRWERDPGRDGWERDGGAAGDGGGLRSVKEWAGAAVSLDDPIEVIEGAGLELAVEGDDHLAGGAADGRSQRERRGKRQQES